MAHYRKIDTRIWSDRKFLSLPGEAKLLFLAILTHPQMTMTGAMVGNINAILALCFSESTPAWYRSCRIMKSIYYIIEQDLLYVEEKLLHDKVSQGIIWAPNFLKYNPLENPNMLTAAESCIDLLPECDLRDGVSQSLEPFRERFGKPVTGSGVQDKQLLSFINTGLLNDSFLSSKRLPTELGAEDKITWLLNYWAEIVKAKGLGKKFTLSPAEMKLLAEQEKRIPDLYTHYSLAFQYILDTPVWPIPGKTYKPQLLSLIKTDKTLLEYSSNASKKKRTLDNPPIARSAKSKDTPPVRIPVEAPLFIPAQQTPLESIEGELSHRVAQSPMESVLEASWQDEEQLWSIPPNRDWTLEENAPQYAEWSAEVLFPWFNWICEGFYRSKGLKFPGKLSQEAENALWDAWETWEFKVGYPEAVHQVLVKLLTISMGPKTIELFETSLVHILDPANVKGNWLGLFEETTV